MNELRRWPFGAVAPLLAIICSDATGPGVSFELAEARWAAEGPSHYQYVYDLSCECGVTGPADFPTVDDLFARLRAEAEADPVQFDVEYDDVLGYPTRASVDVRAEIADDEYSWWRSSRKWSVERSSNG